jgi:Tfp pilus assembly protein PilN
LTEVNLLPPELRRRQRSRSMTRQIIAGFAAIVLLLLILFAVEAIQLSSARDDLASQNAVNASLQHQIAGLQQFADLEAALDRKKTLVADLEQREVLWSGVLHDLSMVMPSQVFLTSFTGQINVGPDGWETAIGASGLIGTLQFQGQSLDFPNVSLWLDRMVDVEGWVNAAVTSATTASSQNAEPGTLPAEGVQFNGSVDLTPQSAQDGTPP